MTPLATGATVTIVRSLSGVLTKRIWTAEGGYRVRGFSAGERFSVHQQEAANFAEFAGLLSRVSGDSYAAIVRGRVLDHVDKRSCRRLSSRAEHGDLVTFEPAPCSWIALDIDGVPEPSCLEYAAEPEGGVEHVLALLPEPFGDASCWWQATSSAGIKPGIRCRLWCCLSRPVSDGEAKKWLAPYPVDRSLFTPVALHYTAPPILAPDTREPVARRCGIRRGLADVVEVPAVLPALSAIAADPVTLDGEELSVEDMATLAGAVRRSPAVRAIWTGDRSFSDRSSRHFHLARALARAGCRDADTLHRVLAACDRRHGADLSKIMRADYTRRTIGAALAAEASQ